MKITITGATGQLGTAVIGYLLKRGFNPADITALARSAEKAQSLIEKGLQVKYGNYNEYDSLTDAFKGADKLLLISGNEMEQRSKQQLTVVKAAKEAGVKHILYTSIQRQTDSDASPIGFVLKSHLETENAIKESGMTYTMLRNNLYMDMLPWVLGEKVFETGIFYPAQEGRIAYTLRDDMAEAIANILMDDDYQNKEYNISNPHSLSFGEIAEHLSVISGTQVNYISPSVETYKATLLGFGVPQMAVDMLAGFAQAANKGELVAGKSDLPSLLGREPGSYKSFLDTLYSRN